MNRFRSTIRAGEDTDIADFHAKGHESPEDFTGYPPKGEQVANIALFMAAPDLLEAAIKALDEMCRTNSPRNSFTDAVDLLDAAITKAEGA